MIRRELLDAVTHRLEWRIDEKVCLIAQEDAEGDVLDAILCALTASRAIMLDRAAVASMPSALEEGWIYI